MYRQSEKKLVKQQYLLYMSPQYGLLAAEIVSLVWGTPGNFNGFRFLAALLHGTLVVGVSQTAALNRGCHLYSAGRPSRWALAHISSSFYFMFNFTQYAVLPHNTEIGMWPQITVTSLHPMYYISLYIFGYYHSITASDSGHEIAYSLPYQQ